MWEWTKSDYHSKTVLDDFLFDEEIWDLYLKWGRSEGDEKEKMRQLVISKYKEPDRQLPVVRGGSWYNDKSWSGCGGRGRNTPADWDDSRGFRCVRA